MLLSAKRRLRRLVILFVVIVLGGSALAFTWIRLAATRPVEHESDRIVTIDQGSGSAAIIDRLADAGIVRQPLALKIYLRITGRGGNLKAGDYKFASPISPLDAIDKIRRGEVYLERVTIPEGFNRFEIAETFAAKTGKAPGKPPKAGGAKAKAEAADAEVET